MPRPKPKVQEIRSGSVVVKIYTTANRTTGELHTVSHYHLGKRVRKNFADLEKAKAHAQSVAAKLSNGELYVLTLRDEDKARYVAGLQALQPTGKALEVACAEYADAFERLRGVGSLTEAVQFFVTHRPKDFVRKPAAIAAAGVSRSISTNPKGRHRFTGDGFFISTLNLRKGPNPGSVSLPRVSTKPGQAHFGGCTGTKKRVILSRAEAARWAQRSRRIPRIHQGRHRQATGFFDCAAHRPPRHHHPRCSAQNDTLF